jgi:GST-like protein
MIDLYTWKTPNGFKIPIALEELGLDYRVHPVDLSKGEQFEPEFLKISPNNKIPAIVDHDGPGGQTMALFESGAILLYLADTTGRLLPSDDTGRWQAVQWLMFQMGGVGPMLGQYGHFRYQAPEVIEYAVDRYAGEVRRLYEVVEAALEGREYLAGGYSVADIACYPWMRLHRRFEIEIGELPRVAAWLERIDGREAVQRGLAILD